MLTYVRALACVFALAFATGAFAQDVSTAMPRAARVTAEVQGSDRIDTVARQLATIGVLEQTLTAAIGQRFATGRTQGEIALARDYNEARVALLRSAGGDRGAIDLRAGQYRRDRAFVEDIATRFLTGEQAVALRESASSLQASQAGARAQNEAAAALEATTADNARSEMEKVWAVVGLIVVLIAGWFAFSFVRGATAKSRDKEAAAHGLGAPDVEGEGLRLYVGAAKLMVGKQIVALSKVRGVEVVEEPALARLTLTVDDLQTPTIEWLINPKDKGRVWYERIRLACERAGNPMNNPA